jgi:hypothetical protein
MGPRDLSVCWFAASEALVEEAGYSPRRKSVLVTVCEVVEHTTSTKTNNSSSNSHHPEHSEVCQPGVSPESCSYPSIVLPEDAVAKIPPRTIIRVVKIMANLRPR